MEVNKTPRPERAEAENAGQAERAKREAAAKRRAAEEYKRRYFAYYDDVKTSIREDW